MNRIHGAVLVAASTLVSCAPFEAWDDYGAMDPKLQFIGRMQFDDDFGPRYAYPGATVRLRCDCTGVDVAFKDEGTGGDKRTNFVNVIVDGKQTAVLKLPNTDNGELLKAVRGLKPGEHTIEFVKRTGPYAGTIQFRGISVQGTLLDPPPLPERRIEIIGESVSCGYGNEVSIKAPNNTEPNTGYHSKNEDNSKAYGALLGRRFDAQVVTTCMWYRGVQRNPDGSTEDTLATRYKRLFPDDDSEEAVWDTRDYVPDVIILNLGVSDFAVRDETNTPSAPDPMLFKAAYAKFVEELRRYYPSAKIICAVGPTMSDYYPKDRQHWTLIQRYVKEMVEELANPNVFYLAHPPASSGSYGEDWHPTAEEHQHMAEALGNFIQTQSGLGW
ncbi:SGNH/GDSL hydrolase family protein [Cystobacter fuscus]|uniref:SGNH/GDSL hydrolase family protein n=1 Tax=Cystobacter fuscus TaxID=43 RepID=UPI002B31B6A7|nr:SGNH/GDSL hydrolase family protein [Cystobacter fuscus]